MGHLYHTVAVLDIGGSKTGAAVFGADQNGTWTIKSRYVSPPVVGRGQAFALSGTAATLQTVIDQAEVRPEAIGLICPGPLNPYTGCIGKSPNMPDLSGAAIRQYIADFFKLPTTFDNDANGAGLGEQQFGAAVGLRNVLYVTVSTGIGGGVISNGQLLRGHSGNAAEIGHQRIPGLGGSDYPLPLCGCGQTDHWEPAASASGFAEYLKHVLHKNGDQPFGGTILRNDMPVDNLTTKHLVEAVRSGDKFAVHMWDQELDRLAVGISNCITMFDPEIVVIGGGLSNAGEDLLAKPLEQRLHALYMAGWEPVPVRIATHRSDAGLWGGLAIALDTSASVSMPR